VTTHSSLLRFWLVSLGALIGVSITFQLGRWQLSRAAQKEGRQAAVEQAERHRPIDTRVLLAAAQPSDLMNRPVVLHGSWLPRHTVYLDNRQMNEKVGFFVVTPLVLEASHAVVLVQRGWVQRNFLDRTALPAVQTPLGEVQVEGRIAPPPSKLFAFGGADRGVIRQNLDIPQFRVETGLPLMDVTVLQTGAPSEGLQREWSPVGTGVETNYSYAIQWFSICGLIAVLYVWFQIFRRFVAPRRPSA
jgi:surfeit locus 1 family protein